MPACNQRYKIVYIDLSISYNVLYHKFFFNILLTILSLVCVRMCSDASTMAESVGYCVAISIVCMCVVHRHTQCCNNDTNNSLWSLCMVIMAQDVFDCSFWQ